MNDCNQVSLEPVSYSRLPLWAEDDHRTALRAFRNSAERLLTLSGEGSGYLGNEPSAPLLAACRLSLRLDPNANQNARGFFEDHFTPHRVTDSSGTPLLTGYYEPWLEGSRRPDKDFAFPIYRRPPDLVNLVADSERGQKANQLTHGRKLGGELVPYPTRAQIEQGALKNQGLEFIWLRDPVDVFFLHVQGSGLISFPDGSTARVTYNGKNGYSYTSIGRYAIDQGLFSEAEMSLDALKSWLKADPERGRNVMWQNESFIFFRELKGKEADNALGVLEIPLSRDRSLAVDTGYHEIGTPIFVSSPAMQHVSSATGLNRLMIAQDVGSAIRGAERGDVFFGSGDEAGRLAGITMHPGTFFVLLAKPELHRS